MRVLRGTCSAFLFFRTVFGSPTLGSMASLDSSLSNVTSKPPQDRRGLDCFNNPYCDYKDKPLPTWHTDCDFPRINIRVWRKNRVEDSLWLNHKFMDYLSLQKNEQGIATDEETFPAYMLKRYAPNAAPSSMLCDGLGMCRVSLFKLVCDELR